MKYVTNKTNSNESMRLLSKKEVKEEILKFKNVNKRDIGTTPYISCPAENWDEVVVLAFLITRAAKITLSVLYYYKKKQIMFVACDWLNRNPNEIKTICIDIFKKYLGNPRLSIILYDLDGNPLFDESQQTMDGFMGDLLSDPNEFHTFSHFPSSGYNDVGIGYNNIKLVDRLSIFNPSQMGII